jgi:hypothetical protein
MSTSVPSDIFLEDQGLPIEAQLEALNVSCASFHESAIRSGEDVHRIAECRSIQTAVMMAIEQLGNPRRRTPYIEKHAPDLYREMQSRLNALKTNPNTWGKNEFLRKS